VEGLGKKKQVDWVGAGLGVVSSGAALVALGANDPRIKLAAGFVGTATTLGSVGYSIYRYNQGRMSGPELALEVSLDVTPFFGSKFGGRAGKAVSDVVEHQLGLGQAIKNIFYDPNK
jgi:hypothetical protein